MSTSKKKYVCKLSFILEHDNYFDQMEAVNLLSSNRYSEKQIVRVLLPFRKCSIIQIFRFIQAYLFITVLVNTNSDLI